MIRNEMGLRDVAGAAVSAVQGAELRRRPEMRAPTDAASNVLVLDLGGSHIGCAVVGNGRVLAESTIRTDAVSLTKHLPEIAAMLREDLRRSGVAASSLRGLAIGYCGVVDGHSGEILSSLDKYRDARTGDLREWARVEFGLPIAMENDARLALLGEVYAGAAKGARDVVMVTLGTGIGGAVMLDGRLLMSRAGQAGALGGHLPVNFRGRLCACGAIGCAEAEASTAVLPAVCRETPGFAESALAGAERLDFATVFAASDAGDAVARRVLEHCIAVWSSLTVGLIHAYGPELVLFGGGVMHRGHEILVPIRGYVERHMWRTSAGVPRIEAAMLGKEAALLGGEALFAGLEMSV